MSGRHKTIGMNLLIIHGKMGGIRNSAAGLSAAVLEAARKRPELSFRLFVSDAGSEFFFGKPEFAESVAALQERCEIVSVPIDPGHKLRLFAWEQLNLRRHLKGIDLLHSFDYRMPYGSRCRNVVMIHDLNYLNFPKTFTRSQRLIRMAAVPASLRFADKVVTISESAKSEIIDRFRVAEDRLEVVHHSYCPPGGEQATNGHNGARPPQVNGHPYVLAVGTLKLHKNYDRLLEAFARLGSRDVKLVIAGRDDGRAAVLRERAAKLGIGDRVSLLGFVSDEELRGLYANARAFVFPSLNEGFGLPLLEAMAQRVPVACSDISVFREIAADAAAYFEPTDSVGMSRAIASVLDDDGRRRALIPAGTERVGVFSWRNSAERMLDVYEEVAGAN